jgi:hypothetical protein
MKIMAMNLSGSDGLGYKTCCVCNAVDGREDSEEFENVGNERERMSRECEEDGNYEDFKPETSIRNVEKSGIGEAE